MCVVSNIGDDYRRTWPDRWPGVDPNPQPWKINPQPFIPVPPQPEISKEDFEALKREVEELKRLLKAAKRFDEKTGQVDCEMDDKVAFIKAVAAIVGVNLDEIFSPKKPKRKFKTPEQLGIRVNRRFVRKGD